MNRRLVLGLLALVAAPLLVLAVLAEEPIYGAQLMTRQEREAYRRQLGTLSTPAARAQFLDRHVKEMQERAHSQGIMLRDELPPGAHGPSTPILGKGG